MSGWDVTNTSTYPALEVPRCSGLWFGPNEIPVRNVLLPAILPLLGGFCGVPDSLQACLILSVLHFEPRGKGYALQATTSAAVLLGVALLRISALRGQTLVGGYEPSSSSVTCQQCACPSDGRTYARLASATVAMSS